MKELNVRSLLIESRVNGNFDITLAKFKGIAKRLTNLSESNKTVNSLMGVDTDHSATKEMLSESSKQFAKAKKLLSESRNCENLKTVNNNITTVNEILNMLEHNAADIEEYLHEAVDVLEAEKKKISESDDIDSFLSESLNLTFKQLVYITGIDADEGFDVLERTNKKGLFRYLKQFAMSSPKITNRSGSSRDDEKFRFNDYIIFMNERNGYIGLEQVISN